MLDVDEALTHVGGFGRFQKMLVLFYGTMAGSAGICMNSFLFIGRAIEPVCPTAAVARGCDVDNVCDYVSGYSPGTPLTTYTVQFDLVCGRAFLLTAATSSIIAGFGVGNCVGGALSNRWGRRLTCLAGMSLVPVAHLAMVLCASVGPLICVRFLIGVACGVQNVAGWTLLMEFVASSSRAAAGGYLWFVWTWWACLPALVAYLCDAHAGVWAGSIAGWRMTTIFLSLPAAVSSGAAWWLLPESPRFLAMSRGEKPLWVLLERVARVNGRPAPVQLAEEGLRRGDFPAARKAAGRAAKGDDEAQSTLSVRTTDLLCGDKSTRGVPIQRMLLVTAFLWFSSTFSYYGLSISISDMAGSVYINNLIGTLLEGPAYGFTGFFCELLGRRRVMWITLISTAACCVVLSLAGDTAQPGWRVLSFIAKFGAALAFSSVYVWTAELFPTDARTVAFGLCNAVARVGGIMAPVIVQLSSVAAMLPSLIFGALSLAGAAACVVLPETRGAALRDTLDHATGGQKPLLAGRESE